MVFMVIVEVEVVVVEGGSAAVVQGARKKSPELVQNESTEREYCTDIYN